MTGGLGPTKDDITKKALASFFQEEMIFDPETHERIQRIFKRLNRPTTEAHREQCYMPANAQLLHNAMGTAPGMWFEKQGKVIISLPGVPYEMKSIMLESGLTRLQSQEGQIPIFHHTLLTAGLGETEIATRMDQIEDQLPEYIKLAYLPALGQVRLRLSAYGGHEEERRQEIDHFANKIKVELGPVVFGEGDNTLEETIGELLHKRGLTLATAESCTGGAIAHRITSVSGASRYYLGSVVAYHNFLKANQLAVPQSVLDEHGAVSKPVVQQMIKGVISTFHANVAISASGVAGPSGGTSDKPVGTIWIAVGNETDIRTKQLHLGKNRQLNIESTAILALNELRLWLLDHQEVMGSGISF